MEFLEKVSVGADIWVHRVDSFGKELFYKDVVLRKLKTKLETRSGEFSITTGECFDNDEKKKLTLVEFTEDVEKYVLDLKYFDLIKKLNDIDFNDNKMYNSFINKVENLYNANKGI